MHLKFVLVFLAFLIIIIPGEAWWRRRRRRSPPPPPPCRSCINSYYTYNGSCSKTCGWGVQKYYRRTVNNECSSCSYPSTKTASCYLKCCKVDCVWNWSTWSSCSGCGYSTQYRRVQIVRSSTCSGKACPSTSNRQSQSCYTGV